MSGASRTIFIAAATIALVSSCFAQDKGYWRAASNNANTITGDISINANSLTIDFYNFPLAQIRTLTPAEVAAAFDADVNAGRGGELYRVKVPADKRFLHKNTLCGTDDTQWMATYIDGRSLDVAFFSGDTPPVLTVEALPNNSNLCGVFTYAR